jgi:hypothetical protein
VNAYGNLKDLNEKIVGKRGELEVLEEKIESSDAEYQKLVKLNAESNQVLGEIKANEKQSMRLQTISDLLLQPKKTRCSTDELSRITVALLNGVAECAKANPDHPASFMKIIRNEVEVAIASFNVYLRGH